MCIYIYAYNMKMCLYIYIYIYIFKYALICGHTHIYIYIYTEVPWYTTHLNCLYVFNAWPPYFRVYCATFCHNYTLFRPGQPWFCIISPPKRNVWICLIPQGEKLKPPMKWDTIPIESDALWVWSSGQLQGPITESSILEDPAGLEIPSPTVLDEHHGDPRCHTPRLKASWRASLWWRRLPMRMAFQWGKQWQITGVKYKGHPIFPAKP